MIPDAHTHMYLSRRETAERRERAARARAVRAAVRLERETRHLGSPDQAGLTARLAARLAAQAEYATSWRSRATRVAAAARDAAPADECVTC